MDMQETKTKRILLIEDDEMMRILFRDSFWIHSTSDQTTEVATTRSLSEARRYLKETAMPPDIIFTGLWLLTKNSDGATTREVAPTLEFIKELRNTAGYEHTCIVAYSRFSDGELKEQARDAGADHFLVKGEMAPREIVDFVEHL